MRTFGSEAASQLGAIPLQAKHSALTHSVVRQHLRCEEAFCSHAHRSAVGQHIPVLSSMLVTLLKASTEVEHPQLAHGSFISTLLLASMLVCGRIEASGTAGPPASSPAPASSPLPGRRPRSTASVSPP